MPFHLPPVSRRQFLAGSLAAGLGVLHYPQRLSADDSSSADHWTLISDTHINLDPATVVRGMNMAKNFRQVVGEILELPEPPAGIILSGDCAIFKAARAITPNWPNCSNPSRKPAARFT